MGRRMVLALGMVTLIAPGIASAQQGRVSIWDGVYTEAQAERGRALYTQNCASCHGTDLAGSFETPPLSGRFMPYWSGTTLDVLFDYVSTAMPLHNPGALGADANIDIIAFLLKGNDIPSGARELNADTLKAIHFDPARRARK